VIPKAKKTSYAWDHFNSHLSHQQNTVEKNTDSPGHHLRVWSFGDHAESLELSLSGGTWSTPELPQQLCIHLYTHHDYVRSSANASSPIRRSMQSRGILFQCTSEKRWIFIVLKEFSRLTLLV